MDLEEREEITVDMVKNSMVEISPRITTEMITMRDE